MIPGRGIALGITMTIVSIVVIAPLAAIVLTLQHVSPAAFAAAAFSPRALAAYRVTATCAALASLIDVAAGTAIAVVLVRYRSPALGFLDALVDVPFALPTAVTGITLATLYGPHGWIGSRLAAHGLQIAYTPAGITLALAFVGLPFVVRTLQPVLAAMPRELGEAAQSLGATRAGTLRRVTLPLLAPAISTGFALALARTLGEYGSVIFIAGNMPYRTEIAPLLIVTRLEEFDYAGAAAIAMVSLAASFVMLLAINALQRRLLALRVAG
jgi:sulfate/thiosulfate transport system permease protein